MPDTETPSQLADSLDQLNRVLDRVPYLSKLKQDILYLKRVMYARRAPRLLFVGGEDAERRALLNALLGKNALPTGDAEAAIGDGEWVRVDAAGCCIDWLACPLDVAPDRLRAALDEEGPDVLLLLSDPLGLADEAERRAVAALAAAVAEGRDTDVPLRVVLRRPASASELALDLDEQRLQKLATEPPLRAESVHVLRDLDDEGGLALVSDALVKGLPPEAHLEAARALVHGATARSDVARELVHSCSTLAVTVALVPIPLSDIAVLGPLQVAMVSSLAHLAGKPWDRKAVLEWIGSVGVVGGAGMGLRWTAQQVLKLVPGAGTIVSASIAGAGTVALGRTAIAYFKL